MSDIREWLERLYSQSPGYFGITAFAGGRPRKTQWFKTSALDAAEKVVTRYADKADLYLSVGTHEAPQETRGGEKSIISIPGFWADIDIGEVGHKPASLPNPPDEQAALSIVEGLPEPSMLMHSGGGLQGFWLFDKPWVFNEPIDKTQAKQAVQEWGNLIEKKGELLGYHIDKVADLARILRVPGSINHKEGLSRPVAIRWADKPAHKTQEITSLGIPDAGYTDTGTMSIEDDFPLSWDEILLPHGYTKCGDDLYSRPGKSCGEGHSLGVNPHGVPVAVNFSGTDENLPTGPGHKLTKLKVWALLNYEGDLKSAKSALKQMVKSTPADWEKVAGRFAQSRIDWEDLWTNVDSEPDWLVEPLIERGRQIAIYSEAKAGKSLLVFEIALALATQGSHTGGQVLGKPLAKAINVVYIDKENGKPDIRERGVKIGYEGVVPANLHYYSFPSLQFLDTDQGGQELYALAKYHNADLVVLDTLSRVVEGDENENDTYHNFYKYTGVRLKADGITLVRLDHSGKDVEQGMRGASSKTTDVDEVWQLKAEENVVTLLRTHTRSAHGDDRLILTRMDNPLRHVVDPHASTTPEIDSIEFNLDMLGVSIKAGLNAAWETYNASDYGGTSKRDKVIAAQKRRQERGK